MLALVRTWIHTWIHTYIHACMHAYIHNTYIPGLSLVRACVCCVHIHHTDGHSSGINQARSSPSSHSLFASQASLPLLISSQVFCFCFCGVCVSILPFRNYWSALVDHAKKSSSRLSNPALYKEPNRQETREAQDRSTESNRLRAKSQETKKKGIEGGRVGWR